MEFTNCLRGSWKDKKRGGRRVEGGCNSRKHGVIKIRSLQWASDVAQGYWNPSGVARNSTALVRGYGGGKERARDSLPLFTFTRTRVAGRVSRAVARARGGTKTLPTGRQRKKGRGGGGRGGPRETGESQDSTGNNRVHVILNPVAPFSYCGGWYAALCAEGGWRRGVLLGAGRNRERGNNLDRPHPPQPEDLHPASSQEMLARRFSNGASVNWPTQTRYQSRGFQPALFHPAIRGAESPDASGCTRKKPDAAR